MAHGGSFDETATQLPGRGRGASRLAHPRPSHENCRPRASPTPGGPVDWSSFKHFIDAYDFPLFTLGKTEITVFTLAKLAISALLLWFLAGRFSRWTLKRLLG